MKDKINEEIRKRIFELADNNCKEFYIKLCPNTDNIVGVRVPILRNYAKEIIKKDWRTYLNIAKNDYHEEVLLQGIIIGIAKMEVKQRLMYLEKFIPKINNWAICDITCTGLKFTKKDPQIVWEFLQKYKKSEKEFEIRFLIVMLLNFYINEEYLDKVIEIIKEIKKEDYYVKMSIAWLISIAYIKYPDKIIKYLRNNNLDNFTHNKSIQKILESYRATNKEEIKNLKRKEENKSGKKDKNKI